MTESPPVPARVQAPDRLGARASREFVPALAARRLWGSEYRPALIATGASAVLAWGFLLLPPMDTDLAAQLARADFAAKYPSSIIDFRWFGGTVVYGYTLWASVLMALLGTKVTGAIAAVVGTWFATRLMDRLRPAHPVVGGLLVAVTQIANVVAGRITFAVGLACALVAVTVFTTTRLPRPAAVSLAVLFSLLCGGASPVAALVLAVAGGVAVLMRRPDAAAVLVLPAACSAAVTSVVFGDGGRQPFSFLDCLKSVLALGIVLAVVPPRCRPIRLGALVGVLVVLAAFALPTPVGSNATRLSLLFALPIVASFIELGGTPLKVGLVGLVCALQLPLDVGTLASTGRPSGYSDYYTPVVNAVRARGPLTGRVEVPDMAGHWDSVYLARGVPLARGWLRQTDVRLNDSVFYRRPPTPQTYWAFLRDNAVQYVAVPDAPLTHYGHDEFDLISGRLPYLDAVWTNQHWTLYQVRGFAPLVDPPSAVVAQHPSAIVIRAPRAATIRVRLRWYRWLGLESADKGACIRSDGLYVTLTTGAGGNYTFTSRFPVGTGHCR
jgi:hypothetical protein